MARMAAQFFAFSFRMCNAFNLLSGVVCSALFTIMFTCCIYTANTKWDGKGEEKMYIFCSFVIQIHRMYLRMEGKKTTLMIRYRKFSGNFTTHRLLAVCHHTCKMSRSKHFQSE